MPCSRKLAPLLSALISSFGDAAIRNLLKAAAAIGGARVFEIAASLVRQKIIAVWLGPSGYFILAWIRNVCDLLTTLPLLGLPAASVKFIAEGSRDENKAAIRRAISATLGAALINVPLALIVYFCISRRHIADVEGIGLPYLTMLRVSLLSVPVMAVVAIFNSFLIGFKQTRRNATLIAACSLVMLIVGTGPVLLWGLWGAAIGLVAASVINAALYTWHFARVFPIALRDFSWRQVWRMRGLAAGDWLGGTFALFALLIVRSRLGDAPFDSEAGGLYNSIFVLCSMYFGPLAHTLIYYTYPRMSELRGREEIVNEINGTLRLMLLLGAPAVVVMRLAIEPLLLILFSGAFVAAAPLLPFQLLGEWFRLPMRSLGMALLGQERLKPYIFFDLLFYAILIAATLLGAQALSFIHLGRTLTSAPCVGYAAGALVGALGYYWMARRAFGFRLGRENQILIASSLSLLAISLFVNPGGSLLWPAQIGKAILLIAWVGLVIRREEWRRLGLLLQTRRRGEERRGDEKMRRP
ncbi:MAG: oligosaccharide flippase family protein [Candidatus Sumerlaeota bacterium]|nr:oligosaccharide flippase family protein [Candidatus Sumerlaeota bacterium]